MKNTIEKDFASDAASKSIMLGKYAQPTETTAVHTANSHKTNVGGVGTPPYVDNSTQLQGKKKSLTETNLFTHSPIHLFTLKQAAFTFAEVLITLGIIGVVAALTLPTVIQNYQKHVTANRLKKAYSVASNALGMAVTEYGDMSSWEVSKEGTNNKISEAYMDKYFLPYLDGSKKVGWKAFYDYYSSPELSGAGGYFVELKDGTILAFAFGTQKDKDGNISYNIPYFYVDINGKAKPNVSGRDIFRFTISGGKVVASTTYRNSLNSAVIGACKTKIADACTELLFRNGWDFPDDYPW